MNRKKRYLNKGRPTWWHLLYHVNLLLKMFRMLVLPSSGACDYYITPPRLKSAQYSLRYNAPSSRKLLKMEVLTSETCWAVDWHNKASVIKLVYLYSNIKIMHGPIRIRKKRLNEEKNNCTESARCVLCCLWRSCLHRQKRLWISIMTYYIRDRRTWHRHSMNSKNSIFKLEYLTDY